MSRRRRKNRMGLWLAGVLALCAVIGCVVFVLGRTNTSTIAYVPLDDRPDNEERVMYLAQSLGYAVAMPEEDTYKTCLDGQPTNANGTQYGDRGALYEWVLAQEKAGCDRYVLSLDQLLSGGLVNSRHMAEGEAVTLSDGTVETELELLDHLLQTLSADRHNQVWLLDTVMRLAPTMGYAGFDLTGYSALRSYGRAARPVLTGAALTVDNIAADYRLGPDGQSIPLPDGMAPLAVADYLSARERKLRLSDEVERLLGEDRYANFHLLVGIDDSSAEDTIQKNEIAYLRQGLREGDGLLSGVDDLGFKAVTRLYLDQTDWQGATVHVDYYGGTEDQPACDYDYQALMEIVAEHLSFFGLTETADRESADMQLLVLTQPKDRENSQVMGNIKALIAQLNDNKWNARPTMLIDAGNDSYGTEFHSQLVEQTDLGWLLSYSGFLDMAIVTGTALSHGVARYAWLQNGHGADDVADEVNRAFARTLADSIVKDFCYRNTVREDLSDYVEQTLSGSPDNFYAPVIDESAVLRQLEPAMVKSTLGTVSNLSHSHMLLSLDPYQEAPWETLSLSNYSFPWHRVFELRMDLSLTPSAPADGAAASAAGR